MDNKTKKTRVFRFLEDTENNLENTLELLQKINENEQFDYCTSSELVTLTDRITELTKKINKIVYQEG